MNDDRDVAVCLLISLREDVGNVDNEEEDACFVCYRFDAPGCHNKP